ncbi:MAG: GIY-YIG nuclease family protein [Pseudomonadota bacterium]
MRRQNSGVGGFVYIMASRKNGTLYTGVTSDLAGRVWEHREKAFPRSFTARHGVTRLVWYQEFDDIRDAIDHEKRVKRWRRSWKLKAIENMNPDWQDLYFDIAQF